MTPKVPQDVEAERAVLGCILHPFDGMAVADDIRQALPRWQQFSDVRHQLIYRAVLCLLDATEPVDTVTVKARLEALPAGKAGKPIDCLSEAGGFAYLMDLATGIDSTGNAIYYANRVADVGIKRDLIRLCDMLKAKALEPATTGTELQELAAAGIEYIAEYMLGGGEIVSMGQIIRPVIDRTKDKGWGDADGLSTGYHGIDKGGAMAKADLIIVAGRPSMGKTAFAMNIAHNAAGKGHPVGVFSLEMSDDSLAFRTLSFLTGISGVAIKNKQLSPHRLSELYAQAYEAEGIPIYFDFSPSPTVAEVRRNARRMVSKHGCEMLVIDYLGLMTLPQAERNDLAVGKVTRALKALAKELQVPIMLLSQLSRDCEKRDNKRPVLSDLRDSGSIEQDADTVIMVYREHVYDKNAPEDGVEILVRKRREGPTGEVQMRLDKPTGRFTEVADARDERTF